MKPCKCGNPEVTATSKGFKYVIHCEECGYSTGVRGSFTEAAKVDKKYLRRGKVRT